MINNKNNKSNEAEAPSNGMEPQVNKEHYFHRKYDDLNRFISYFYQADLVRQCDANIRMHPSTKVKLSAGHSANDTNNLRILEIGKGNGFFTDYMKKLGYNVTTCDFDQNLQPDVVADVRNLPFSESSFDVVTAFEVLEHIPFEDFPKSLAELEKVSKKYVILSLPYRSTGWEFVLKFPGIRTLLRRPFLSIFLRWPLRFGGIEVSGQHCWEIDCWRWRLSKVRKLLRQHFKIVKEVRPVLNHHHYFFVLESR